MSNIRTSPPPNRIGIQRVAFRKRDFDTAIFNYGYDAIVRHAVECPCKSQGSTNVSSCQNCLGLGWVFINPFKTRAILTSINKNTEYKYWSPEFKGTIAATFRDVDRLSFMDLVTLEDNTSLLSEVRPVRISGAQKFIFTSYPVKRINTIFIYNSDSEPLIKLSADDYSVSVYNPQVVKLSSGISFPTDFNDVVTIDYEHEIAYNVIDIPHDFRSSIKVNTNGKEERMELPMQAICQKSHFVNSSSPKFDGTGIKDNSYL